jgi:L-ascorbate metabolism protein UlaG (beta-lactamase superfamily)
MSSRGAAVPKPHTRRSGRWNRWNVSLNDLQYIRRLNEDRLRPIAPAPHKPEPSKWRDDRLTASWLGHSTVLLNFFGVRIITDPVLRRRVGVRVGPVTFGPKRYVAPALRARELPRLDIVILTHAHMDHFDMGTLRQLPRNVTIVTAKATADLLRRMRFKEVVELDWGESHIFHTKHGAVRIEAFRVQHWGARVRHDSHRGFNGYVVERKGRRVVLAGDTAHMNFSAIGRKGAVDLMAVPIGAYNPWVAVHCTPEQAVQMANQARAKYVLPIHHQTFRLGREPMDEPLRRFERALEPDRIALREIGETFVLP